MFARASMMESEAVTDVGESFGVRETPLKDSAAIGVDLDLPDRFDSGALEAKIESPDSRKERAMPHRLPMARSAAPRMARTVSPARSIFWRICARPTRCISSIVRARAKVLRWASWTARSAVQT